jgi:hypothetical protein
MTFRGHSWKEVWPCVGTNPPVALPAHLNAPSPAELLVDCSLSDHESGVGFENVLVSAAFGCSPRGTTSSLPT